ncbi:MAG: electron transfer flavoprotein subunit alpha/FixB family protein [Candidatus Rokubacteria bacterium]|nr:electron transfer flavoprotein subunit alpha/FixB family protein [Candidatus Rokubacteria bacterium]
MSQDVAVVVEHLAGRVADVSFEMLARGRELSRATGGRLVAVAVGHDLAPLVSELGAADAVVLSQDPSLVHYTPDAHQRALAAILLPRGPRVTLVANTAMGMDLAAGLSGALAWPLVAYCRDARVDGGRLLATSQIYGGKILAEAEVEGAHALLSILAGSSSAEAGRAAGAPRVEEVQAPAGGGARVRFKRLIMPEAGDVDITRQAVLVSVGRGIQSRDNLPIAKELAEALGGVVAASRPIVDQGWLPKTRQVGKSGMSVTPKLYLALGISGAPEHLEGMRGAELIVAVNTDPNAPIFGVAHYGVATDLFDVLPILTEKIKAGR